ncbi:MAG: DUF2254 domain-containing protein [Sphingomonas sp.]|nr:DUF2254 domain-containing protein [Sphingomonas sp.]
MARPLPRVVQELRASYWFLPSIMAVAAIGLGALMVWLDAGPATGVLDGLGWYQKAKPDGAHQVLSTIAGSMITVAGVVFSITIVAIAYAASQYGPRVLTNFMSDRGNQATLGTFIATFVYCLVVLRTIRGGDEGEFVPQLAVMMGLLLALCSIAVLIYFIHHVPLSIHINNVVARIGNQLIHSVEKRFPARIGDPPEKHRQERGQSSEAERALSEGVGVTAIEAPANGYIEAVDDDRLMDIARDHDVVLKLHHNPGEYLFSGQLLVSAWPAGKLDKEAQDRVADVYDIGNNRTPAQDMDFLVDELVEISARALSTGVNDPFTAITCLDWLGAAATQLGRRRIPAGRRLDRDGALRVIASPQTFKGFVERGFGRMRQYLAQDMNAAMHALDVLAAVARCSEGPERLEPLAAEAEGLMALAELELKAPTLARMREHYATLAPAFSGGFGEARLPIPG